MKKVLLVVVALFSYASLTKAGDGAKLDFIENRNQWAEQVKYRADISGGAVFLTQKGFIYSYYSQADLGIIHELKHKSANKALRQPVHQHAYSVSFPGGNMKADMQASSKQAYYRNYFLGNDPAKWAGGVGAFREIRYKGLYAGIDMNVYSTATSMKYDFIVAAGADPAQVKMQFDGVQPSLTKEGDLKIKTSVNTIVEKAPYVYQVVNGIQKPVSCNYVLGKNNVVSFAFPLGYDHSKELVIDPVLVFATFSGSTASTYGYSAAYDSSGHLYAGGEVFDVGWPTTTGAFQTAFGGSVDAGLNKYAPDGSTLIYSTYFGGNFSDLPNSMIVNSNDELVITGSTTSDDMPVTAGCLDNTLGGYSDIYVAKFSASGTALLASTYVGGSAVDGVNSFFLSSNYGDGNRGDLQIDPSGNVIVSASTESSDFPTTSGAYQTSSGGNADGCIFKLNSSFSSLIFSTYLGGNQEDACFSLVQKSTGDLVVTGGTLSPDFPTSAGALHTTAPGGTDGFVSILSADGANLLHSTYLGTNDYDHAFKVQVDPSDNVYVCGQTSGNYPVSAGVYTNAGGGIFIHKLSPDLTTSILSTRIGPNPLFTDNLIPTAFLYDNCGNIYFCGNFGLATPAPLPVTPNALQSAQGGFWLCVLAPNMSSLSYASYMGGLNDHVDGGSSRFDPQGRVYHSVCTNNGFNATPGSWCPNSLSQDWDVASFKMDFQAMGVVAAASIAGNDSICIPSSVQFVNTSSSASNYTWDFGDGTPPSSSVAPTHTYAATGIYTVSLHANNPALCITDDTAYVTVHVFQAVVPQVTVKDTVVCGEGNITLTAQVANLGNNTYFHWEPASVILSDPNQQSVLVSGAVSNTFIVTVTDSAGLCKESVQRTITLTHSDVGNFHAFGDTTICPGDTALLYAVGGNFYSWTPDNKITDVTVAQVKVYPNYTTTYNVLVEDNLGCKTELPVTVTVHPAAIVDAGEEMFMKYGDALYLDATGNVSSYTWSPAYAISTLIGPNPKVSPDKTTQYFVTGTSAQGCKAIDSVVVNVMNAIIPSAFTPNGDNRNDVFRVLPTNIEVKLLDLSVYNRFGERIFNATDINQGWDGNYKGMPADIGTYFYALTYVIGHKQFIEKGDVTLVR
jgi:gliding motility-associated-like protein